MQIVFRSVVIHSSFLYFFLSLLLGGRQQLERFRRQGAVYQMQHRADQARLRVGGECAGVHVGCTPGPKKKKKEEEEEEGGGGGGEKEEKEKEKEKEMIVIMISFVWVENQHSLLCSITDIHVSFSPCLLAGVE